MAERAKRLEDVLTRHQVFLQGLSANQAARFDPFLQRVAKYLRGKLNGGALTLYTQNRLEKLLEAVDGFIGDQTLTFRRELMTDLAAFWLHEAEFTGRALTDANPGFEPVIPSPVQIRAAVLSAPLATRGPDGSQLLGEFLKGWSDSERRSVVGAIRLGVFQGQTNAQIVQALIGTRAARFTDGILNVTRRHAAAVVHTAVQHVSTVARMETFAGNADVVRGVRWISTLDSRTCLRCSGLDRAEFALAKGPRPPLHVQCRCTVIAVLKGSTQQGGTRASAGASGGKQVPAGLTYFQWLRDQPAGFQDAAVGPARAKLLREGGLSATRFAELQLDRNFAPMTLEQMRRLEPLAFANAGL